MPYISHKRINLSNASKNTSFNLLNCLIVFGLFLVLPSTVYAGLTLNSTASTVDIATAIEGPGLTLGNNSLTVTAGIAGKQYGTFTGGTESSGAGPVIGIQAGVFLSTGDLNTILGPNNVGNYSVSATTYTDIDLVNISPNARYDPSIIEFDVVPLGDKLNFVLVFGSEEYPEYVCTVFNDAFGMFVSGPGFTSTQNAAFIPGTSDAITVNNVNNGSAGGTGATCTLTNSAYFTDNGNAGGNANTQLDGFTKPITASLTGLQRGETYHIKLAIADAGDGAWDSGAFFKWVTSTDTLPIDMELNAVASTLTPTQNSTLDITYTVSNQSTTEDNDLVQTQLNWPNGVTVVSHNGGGGYDTATAVWEAGTVVKNQSKSITFTVQVGADANYTPSAEILFALHEDPDSTPFNRSAFPNEDDTASLSLFPQSNQAPVISSNAGAPLSIDVEENSASVSDIDASDAEDGAETNLSYSLSGDDASKFIIDVNGIIVFKIAPDFENSTDIDTNNIYDISVQVTDANGLNDAQAIQVTVINNNDVPILTSAISVDVNENTTNVTAITSTDQDAGDTASYTISGGTDAVFFVLDIATGELVFIVPPDFENSQDFSNDNIYELEITVSDSQSATAIQQLSVMVIDLIEDPVITSSNTVSIEENNTPIITVTAQTEDDISKTFAITGGVDHGQLQIDPNTGELSFKNSPNFENPADLNSDNTYHVEVTVSDANSNVDVQPLAVAVTNVNDVPTATNETLQTLEDTRVSDSVFTDVYDEDGDTLSFSLSTDVQHGTLSFDGTTGNYSYLPLSQYNGVDSFVYQVTDAAGDTASAQVDITVSPIDDVPAIFLNTHQGSSATLDWNTQNWAAGQSTNFTVDDTGININLGGAIAYVGIGDNTNITAGLGGSEQSLSWTVDPSNTAEQGKLVISFNRPVTNVNFTLLDIDSGSSNLSSQMEKMHIEGLFRGQLISPVLTPANLNVVSVSGNQLIAAAATPVANNSSAGNVDVAFNSLVDTIVITYGSQVGANVNPSWLDFGLSDIYFEKAQGDNTVIFVEHDPAVQINDASARVFDSLENDIKSLVINVTGLADGTDESIVILGEAFVLDSDKTANVSSDATNMQITYIASTATFSVIEASADILLEDALSALLLSMTYENISHAPNESDRGVRFIATDVGGLSSDVVVTSIKVQASNDAPQLTANTNVTVSENQTNIMILASSDPDTGDVAQYSISGGIDQALFDVDTNTGVLTFKVASDFELPVDSDNNNIYLVDVAVTDDEGATDGQSIEIHVIDAQDVPSIILGNTISALENTTAVITVTAIDQDVLDSLSFSFSGGADQNLFTIDSNTGKLSFVTAPNFEDPKSANTDNSYQVEVSVSDGNGNTASQLFVVTVNNANDAPVFTEAEISLSTDENQTSVTQVSAIDEDNGILIYSLTGGVDIALFDVNESSGAITFNLAPDFELPSDADSNNIYELIVKVDDVNGGEATQLLHITVKDVGIRFGMKAILQGPFNGTDMSDDLRLQGLIPEVEPYTAMAYSPVAPLSLNTELLNINGDDAIIDWVLLELREGSDASTVIKQWAALIQRDGDVVLPTTGSTVFADDGIVAGEYYLSIRHRNHLGVITQKVTLNTVINIADFSDPNYGTQGTEGRLIVANMAVLWAGDSNGDGNVIAQGISNDSNILFGSILGDLNNTDLNASYILRGYLSSDTNLDGNTIYVGSNNDVNLIIGNVLLHAGNILFNANYIVNQQLP